MPTCVFRHCKNYSQKTLKGQGITYHSFPTDELRLIKWTDIVRRQRREEDWQPTGSSRICSDHFKEDDRYKTNKGHTFLKKTAVPIFEDTWLYISRGAPASPNSLDGENISELDWVFGTPEITALKKRIHKINSDKKDLRRKNINLAKRNKRLQKNAANMKTIFKQLHKKNYIFKDTLDKLNLEPEVLSVLNRVVPKRNSKTSSRLQYPHATQNCSVQLNYFSQTGYEHGRKTFKTAFPHSQFFRKWCENNTASPGFTIQAFDILKEKCVSSGKRLLCALITDEITLQHKSKWSGKKTDGVVDFGDSTFSRTIATEAYVFLLAGIKDTWTLPVGYFFVKDVTAQTRAYLITSCLRKCYYSGVDVVTATFDGSPANIAAANILGCNLNNPHNLRTIFKHPECDTHVAVFFEPNHMIELVRNTFESKKIIFNESNRGIKWQLLIKLNKLQTNEQLNFANRRTERHLRFRNEVMKVSLTTQLLSKSVANVLELCEQILESFGIDDTAATVEFIEYFNDLFNILNSRFSDITYLKKSFDSNNSVDIVEFLDRVKHYILSLKINVKTRSVVGERSTIIVNRKRLVDCKCNTGFLGFLVCIDSLKHLFSLLVEIEPTQHHIPAYRLSQNHVEVLFGLNRKYGYDNRPSAVQFKEIYKKMINHILLQHIRTGNIITLDSIPILSSSSAVLNINLTTGRREILDDVCDNSEELKIIKSNKIPPENAYIFANMLNNTKEYIKYIVGYISGWIAKKLVNVLKCETCVDALLTQEKMWFHKLISITHIGGLCYSTENVFIICLKAENIIQSFIKENEVYVPTNNHIDIVKYKILKSFINSNVFNNLLYHAMTQPPTFNHRLQLIKAIIKEYTDVRFRSAIKSKNDF